MALFCMNHLLSLRGKYDAIYEDYFIVIVSNYPQRLLVYLPTHNPKFLLLNDFLTFINKSMPAVNLTNNAVFGGFNC